MPYDHPHSRSWPALPARSAAKSGKIPAAHHTKGRWRALFSNSKHEAYPQLLHHRPHRPRQVHAGRPLHPALRRPVRPRNGGPGTRLHGSGARARHHDQGADRRPGIPGARRADLPAQPDRHAWPRRFLLRGVALAGCLRGGAAGGGCLPGSGSAKRGKLLQRHRAGGEGVQDALEAVVARIPPPKGDSRAPLKALIIDSWFDNYVGVVMLVRVVDGVLRPKDRILLMASRAAYLCEQVGVFTPKSKAREQLGAGEVGFIIAGIKELKSAKVGDTVTLADRPAAEPLPGFKEIKPQVFAGLYPVESHDYDALRDALEKLKLNDASLQYEPETSQALGFGFRCGFLGLLHMDIVQERLEREYNMDLITTAPTVIYQVLLRDGTLVEIENPSRLPDLSKIAEIREPIINATILVPQEYLGAVITLCTHKRGVQRNMQYMGRQVMLSYEMPLNEVVMDFFDKLKSASRGYASLDYEFKEFRAADLVKLDILVNGDKVDALSLIVHRSVSQHRGRELAAKMRELIPRQMFDVAVQAAVGSPIIALENVKALRKNVLAKCYGGDITRKRKLLEKQKAGKKRMKQVGNVEIPQEAFLAILQVGK